LRDLSNEHPDATLAELSELFFKPTGIKVNGSTIARKLRQLRISRKKKTFPASERDTPEVQQERKEFQDDKPNLPGSKLIFIAESGINTGMART
jgi:transposase